MLKAHFIAAATAILATAPIYSFGAEVDSCCVVDDSCGDGCGLSLSEPDAIWCCPGDVSEKWCSFGQQLEESGIEFGGDITQYYQGVASGGVQERFRYAGHAEYELKFDLGKLAKLPGWSLMMRAEHLWGQSVGRDAGVLLPPSLHAVTPTPETNEVLLTNVLFTGPVTENLIVFFGKLDTLDGDRNPFATGKGKTQFMNTNLLVPVHALPTVPLATLGAGAIYLVDGQPFASLSVLNATDTLTTAGFNELFNEGVILYGSVNVPLPIAGKTGVHTFSGMWSSRTYTALDQDPRLIIGRVPIEETEGSWVAWWSGTQYLYQNPNDPTKGWGLFGRIGASDGSVNPVDFFVNFGVGGQSPIRGRENDQFGVGWFYNDNSDQLGPIANILLGVGNSSTGVELYYNYAVNEHLRFTTDLQVIEPGLRTANTALLVGFRAQVLF